MKKRILAIVLVAALLLGNLPGIAMAAQQTAGTADDPYSIATAAEFVEFLENAENTSGTTGYYRLTADIKADGQYSTLGGYTAMDVVLDGGGHTISGFDVSGAIFSKITASTIRSVNFSNMNVTATGGSAAVIAAVNEGMILNCTVEADCTIKGTAQMAGGLAAENGRSGILTNSISRVSIPYAAGVAGVLVGKNTGILQHCYGRIQNDITLYGVSSGSGASVSDCLSWKNGVYALTAKGGEKPLDMDIRQLAAEMTEMTQNDNNALVVDGPEEYGALWAVENGDLALSLDGRTAQIYLYADQSLIDAKFTFTDREAYPVQTENGQKFSVRAGYYLDGVYYSNRFTVALALTEQFTMVNSFVYRPNQEYVKMLTNLIDGNHEVTYVDAFLRANYDRDTGISQSTSVVYPYCATLTLSNRKTEDEIVDYVFEGSGTPDDPYQISSGYELQCLASHVKNGLSHNGLRFNEAHYILTRDIDLSGKNFEPIGVYSRDHSLAFRGSFDGQGYQIKGLTLNSGRTYCGIFGITAGRATETGVENAVIKNLNVSGLSVGSSAVYGDLVGGIVGMAAYTTIDGCVVQGSITAGTQVGGIVGYAYHCQLRNCGANVNITTMSCYAWSGGIAGYGVHSTVDTSYSACSFTNENVILEEYLHTGSVAGYRKDLTVLGCVFLPSDRINVGKTGSGIFEGSPVLLRSEELLLWLQTTSEQQGFQSAWEAGADVSWNEGYPVIQLSKERTYQVTCQRTTAGSVLCVEPSSGEAVEQARYTGGRTVIVTTTDPTLKGLKLVDGSTNVLDIPVTREGAYTFSFTMPRQAVWIIPDFGAEALCGRGTAEDPYWIYSKGCLDAMAELINSGAPHGEGCEPYKSAHYKMIRDVDFGGSAIRPISAFEGQFDGNGHTISNARVQGVASALFYKLNNARIKNLVLEGTTVEGRESAILAQSTTGDTVLANIMVLGAQSTGAQCGSLIYTSEGSLAVVNCIMEDMTFSGNGAWVLWSGGNSTVALKNILLSGDDATAITAVDSVDQSENLTQEQVLCCRTGDVTWKQIAGLGAVAAKLSAYGACGWTVADMENDDNIRPRLCYDGVGAVGTISCDGVFSTSIVKLFDVKDVPEAAAAGQIVEIPCYLNASRGNLKILASNGAELSFTVDVNGEKEGMGFIQFEMPAGAVTITNNGQPLKMLYLEGEGTKNAPFEIWTPADLVLMADVISQRQLQYVSGTDYVDYTNGCFKLMADLDMEGVAWEGIGTEQYTFFGTLDGNGHTIRNLNVNNGQGETQCPGLFLIIGQGGTVRNLTMEDAVVFPGGAADAAGVIAHKNMGAIAQCVVTNSSVSLGNYAYLGGIVGLNDATGAIVNCAVRGSTLTRRFGGASTQPMGGITQQNNGLVCGCYTYGCTFVNGTGANGGLISSGNGPQNCYYDSTMTNIANDFGIMAAQFASGQVAYLLQGQQTSSVWGQTIGVDPYPMLGGAEVYAVGSCTAITGYSNTDTGGGHKYRDDGFCYYCDDYQPAADSNADGVYEIGNAGQLYWFAALVNRGNVFAGAVLSNDIRVNQDPYVPMREWVPIGTPSQSYRGHFDGQGYGIELLYGSKSVEGVQGMFGAIGPGGMVERVIVEAIFSNADSIGGIAAINQGTIRNCVGEVYVPVGDVIGGIAAVNEGQVLHCFCAYVQITGENRGVVENCYYLTDAENADGGRTEAQAASGEVAYLLQALQEDQIWGQKIGTDDYPTLNGPAVYDVSDCAEKKYSNTDTGRAYHQYQNGFCTVCGAYESATDTDGDGVYEIANGGQLFWFASQVDGGDSSASAILMADIHLENREWTPIGTQEKPFTGRFDGQGHTISQLSCTEEIGYRGLFGFVGKDGVVENVGLRNSVISGGNYIGGIAGYNQGSIQKCFSCAAVTGSVYVGGIAGLNEGQIANCCNSGAVSGTDIVAGITGRNDTGGTVRYCCNAGEGPVAAEFKGEVRRCYYLFERDNRAGGKTAEQFASGEVAYLLQEEQTEAVWGQSIGTDAYPVLGGPAVYQGGPCHDSQYHNSAFDVTHIYQNGFCIHCDAYQSAKYANGAYQITNGGQLFWFASQVNGGNGSADAVLTADIDLENRAWTSIGSHGAYGGSFDGGYYTVSGLAGSLFGTIGTEGIVRYLELEASSDLAAVNDGVIECSAVRGGRLAATHNGKIICCYTTANAVMGSGSGAVKNSYCLTDTDTGSGKTAAQFASGQVAYLLQGQQTSSVWGQTIGVDPYPMLGGAEVYAVGSCTAITGYSNTDTGGGHKYRDDGFCYYCDDYQPAADSNADGVYEIGNAGQLYWFAALVNSGNVFADAVLSNDIRINHDVLIRMREWVPIGAPSRSFRGHFDGQGYGIELLYGSKSVEGVLGLFGAIGPEGLVERVSVEALFYDGDNIGGIAAINQGIIRNCVGEILASEDSVTGCIAAVNEGQILHCFTTAGQIVGDNRGVVENCYYLADAENADGGRTEDQFASGEVAYLLQAAQIGRVWGQKIGTDDYPTLNGLQVYRGGLCDREYSNSAKPVTHSFDNGFCTLCDAYEAAPDTNGDGYYEIGNGGQLYWFATLVNSGKTYSNAVLTADITVNPSVAAEQNDVLRSWLAIGSDGLPFSGVFDGKGYSISGLYRYITEITFKDLEENELDWNMTGLFGSVSKGGTVMNVNLKDSYFRGLFYVGGIAGTNYGKILNCTVDMHITTVGMYVGGIAGANDGNITNCVNRTSVTGNGVMTGGIVGSHGSGIIMGCVNEGPVTMPNTGSYGTGGIAGESTATIRDCVNNATITGGWFTGGVVGCNNDKAILEKCANFGEVIGVNCAGGVCGDNEAVVRDCYNTGAVSSRDYGSAGVAGENNGEIANCYNIGTVTSDAGYAGGIVGTESESVIVDGKVSKITNCYYLPGCATDGGGTVQNGVGLYSVGKTKPDVVGETEAKTAQQFASGQVAYLLDDSTSDGTLAWGQDLDNGQPPQDFPVLDGAVVYFGSACTKQYSNNSVKQGHYFSENGFCTGCDAYEAATDRNGDGIYEIANGGQLFWFAAVVNGGYGDTAANSAARAIMTADIDLENREWTPVGTDARPYAGEFDGRCYVISRLYIHISADFQGLFGSVGSNGIVEDVGLTDSTINGGNYIGGIAGYNQGIIKKCFNEALVKGGSYVGGIAGSNERDISNCYNVGIISGADHTGGIAGTNKTYGTIANCHNAVDGGIVADNQGVIDNCYYLADDENTGGGRTAVQFAAGEVAYLLQELQTEQVWGQNLDNSLPNSGYPVLNGAAVYAAGGGYSNDASKPAITQKGRTLSYEDLIYVIDIFDLSNVEGVDLTEDAGLLIWSVEEFEALTQIAFDAEHANVGLTSYKDTGYYYGASDGIFTRDLHEDAYYVGYVKLADGSYIYSEARLYSPAIYAYAMLEKDTTSAETRILCVALLNYISAAQGYFYGTAGDALVNADLSDEQKALNWTDISLNLAPAVPADKQVERDSNVFAGTGKNLLFEEMISLTAIYKIDDSIVANAKECGTIFWTVEQFATLEGAPSIDNLGGGTKTGLSQYRGNAGQWYSLAPKLAAKEMADTQYFYMGYVIHEDGSVSYSGVMSYTVEQYIGNMVSGENTSAEMLAFAQRLYFYERAAKQALG